MTLRSFSVENYRCFVEETQIELRPLTLLFGYNSAGKSSLMRALSLIAGSIDSELPGLDLRTGAARGATFRDLRSRIDRSLATVSLSLRWHPSPISSTGIRWRIGQLSETPRQLVESFELRHRRPEETVTGTLELPARERDLGPGPHSYSFGRPCDATLERAGVSFGGLSPTSEVRTGWIRGLLDASLSELRDLERRLHVLGPLRSVPPRRTALRLPSASVEPSGQGAGDILALDDKEDGGILTTVSGWYEAVTRHRLEVHWTAGDTEEFALAVSPVDGDPLRIPLADTGDGMIQILPVLVLGAQALQGKLGERPVLAIENPELHLHPAAERELGRFLVRVASERPGVSTLVESHSENLLLRIQLALVQEVLSPDQVLVYWVHQREDGSSRADRIELDELGRPVGDRWPPGVFAEDTEQARELVLARMAREDAP